MQLINQLTGDTMKEKRLTKKERKQAYLARKKRKNPAKKQWSE